MLSRSDAKYFPNSPWTVGARFAACARNSAEGSFARSAEKRR